MEPITTAATLLALSGALLALRRARRRLADAHAEARTDALTGAWNGRAWLERTSRLQRAAAPFTFALFDVANLKAMNEALGHAGADEVLRELAFAFRASEFVGYRTGGDEFALVFEGGSAEVRATAERARDRVEAAFGERQVAAGVLAFVTGAVGTWRPGLELAEELRCADAALELRKASRKAALGLPATRAETLARLAA